MINYENLLVNCGLEWQPADSKVFVEQLRPEDSFLTLSSQEMHWHVPEKRVTELLKICEESGFNVFDFKIDQRGANGGYFVLYSSFKLNNYENLENFEVFLQSGLVRGAMSQGGHFVLPKNLTDYYLKMHQGGLSDDQLPTWADALIQEDGANSPIAFNERGKIYMHLNESAQAAEAFTHANKLNSKYAEPYSNLAVLLWQADMKEKAFHLFQNALALCPWHIDIQDNFINAGIELEQLEKLVESLVIVEKFYPDYIKLNYLKALVYAKAERKDLAIIALQNLIQSEPNHAAAKELLTELNS